MNLPDLRKRIATGESATLEFKTSTGQLKRAGETLCAFLNGDGGTVFFGVRPNGAIEGQTVSDAMLREIAQVTERFDPPANVAIVVFDDRIEIRSSGRLPRGITVKQLSGKHESKPTNPLIAEAFRRTGAVEVWGRGTNRVISLCKRHGASPPTFREESGFVTVTFKAQMVAGDASRNSRAQSGAQSGAQSRAQSAMILNALSRGALSGSALADALGMRSKTGALKRTLGELLSDALIEYTLPDKPKSRLQKYRWTKVGEKTLMEQEST